MLPDDHAASEFSLLAPPVHHNDLVDGSNELVIGANEFVREQPPQEVPAAVVNTVDQSTQTSFFTSEEQQQSAVMVELISMVCELDDRVSKLSKQLTKRRRRIPSKYHHLTSLRRF